VLTFADLRFAIIMRLCLFQEYEGLLFIIQKAARLLVRVASFRGIFGPLLYLGVLCDTICIALLISQYQIMFCLVNIAFAVPNLGLLN
jgi:hypothetical protein